MREKIDYSKVEQIYVPGKIVEYSWGYDQTNIDYFLITKRTKTQVTLVAIGTKNVEETGFLQGRCEPDPENILGEKCWAEEWRKPFNKKVSVWGNKEQGIAMKSYGWASLWSGKPSSWSSYH